jgi:hypothetical protein
MRSALFVCLVCVACQPPRMPVAGPPPGYDEAGENPPTSEIESFTQAPAAVMDALEQVLAGEGFPVDARDDAAGNLTTAWTEAGGWYSRCHVRVDPAPDAGSSARVRCNLYSAASFGNPGFVYSSMYGQLFRKTRALLNRPKQ